MHTVRLPTVRASGGIPDIRTSGGGVGPQVNTFEQVSRDGQQMSLGEGAGPSDIQGSGGERLYSEVQCIMGNGQ